MAAAAPVTSRFAGPACWCDDEPLTKMRADDFRRIALAMEGAVEGAHMGHPDFRVNNRIFATLHHDREFLGGT